MDAGNGIFHRTAMAGWNRIKRLLLVSTLLLFAATTARADLAAVGPANTPSPPGNGYPKWYQDLNGLALDICLPDAIDPGGLQGSACQVIPGPPDPPFTFPGNFPEEVFYQRAVSDILPMPGGKKAILVLALEGAFFNGPVAAGDQIVFTRIRVTAGVPVAGTYTVTHPYGVEVFPDVQPGVGNHDIFFSEDVGITAPGLFTEALTSRFGPFMQASAFPGGPPSPFLTLNGAQFLSNAVTPVNLTGSPFNTNYFEICGPAGSNLGGPDIPCLRTNLFTLTGRVHTAPIPSPLAVPRATYSRTAGSAQVDVVATAKNGPAQLAPILSFGARDLPSVLMAGPVGRGEYYGQAIPLNPASVPAAVVVTNSGDNPPSSVTKNVVDKVTISQASYDGQNMTIQAASSDALVPPKLIVQGLPGSATGSELLDGTGHLVFPVGPVPPTAVTVISSAGGMDTEMVSMSLSAVPFPPGAPVTFDDSAITPAGAAVPIDVLVNDVGYNPATVQIVTPAANGGLVVDPATGVITYTPTNPAFAGTDLFEYLVRSAPAGLPSNVAMVTVTVLPPPGGVAPIANADGPFVLNPRASLVIDVLANDSANGGTLNPATVTIVSPVTGGTVTSINPATGAVSFVAGAVAGPFGFSYTVANTNGQVSAPVVVTGTVTSPEIITVTRAQYTRSGSRWVISGITTVPGPANTITARVGSTLAGQVIGTATVDALGNWKMDVRNSLAIPDATKTISLSSSAGGSKLAVPVTIK